MVKRWTIMALCLSMWTSDIHAEELAIYPGFTKEEIATSVRSLLTVVQQCSAGGNADGRIKTRRSVAPHLGATVIDGKPVTILERSVDLRCKAKPVHRCSVTYAWPDGYPSAGYASVQCVGSHEASFTNYVLSATSDVRKAKRAKLANTPRDKAIIADSIVFQTDAFPGILVQAFGSHSRRTGATKERVEVIQFDSFDNEDNASDSVSTEALHQLTEEALRAACIVVGQCDTEGAHLRLPDGSDDG